MDLDTLFAEGDSTEAAELGLGERASRALAHCMGALQPRQRECIALAFQGGLTHPEVAAEIGEPLGSVKSWIRRGLAALKAVPRIMNREQPETLDLLAAEYALGTLTGGARRNFERWRARDPFVARRVRAWEDRFAVLALRLAPVAPSPSVWSAIERRTTGTPSRRRLARPGCGHRSRSRCSGLAG